MKLYRGADLIECEIGGRPLFLPFLSEDTGCLLLDCGTQAHAKEEVPAFVDRNGSNPNRPFWLIITHPDGDHCGGTHIIHELYPSVRIACGDQDRLLVESPDYLFNFRYDAYRENHGISYNQETADAIRSCFAAPQLMTLTFVGGEMLRLGKDRILEIWHLPGHSHGHLGVYDQTNRVLYYGDAIQGAGYKSITGQWSLCPTYLYVDSYLATIHAIENSGADTIVGCHWPVFQGTDNIKQFCSESRDFVVRADQMIHSYLQQHTSGATLRELCDELGGQLGDWPVSVNSDLAWAFSGHLERGVTSRRIVEDRSVHPFIYRPF